MFSVLPSMPSVAKKTELRHGGMGTQRGLIVDSGGSDGACRNNASGSSMSLQLIAAISTSGS